MSGGCLWRVFSHKLRGVCCSSGTYGCLTPPPRLLAGSRGCMNSTLLWRWSPFCTAVDDTDAKTPPPSKKNKPDPHARVTIGSVGRKIPYRLLEVISESGENMGTMHRMDVLRLMDTQGLKLVVLNERKDPPVYRLMSGVQIHEEQMKLREKQKTKAAVVQQKELTFSSDIATHDLSTKLKQLESWLQKKHHVKVTLRARRAGRQGPSETLHVTLEEMLQQMNVPMGFVSEPKTIREGKAAVCVVRPPSAKELAKRKKETKEVPPEASTEQPSHATTAKTDESVQQ